MYSSCVCVFLSGCMQFLEGMELNYNSQAADNGVYVIGSCGFDSIPADMGVLYTREQFKGMHPYTHKHTDALTINPSALTLICSGSFTSPFCCY